LKKSTINLTKEVTTGLGLALGKKFSIEESPARMAWIVLLLKATKDKPGWFPQGKWATIQDIEQQLSEAAQQQMNRAGKGA